MAGSGRRKKPPPLPGGLDVQLRFTRRTPPVAPCLASDTVGADLVSVTFDSETPPGWSEVMSNPPRVRLSTGVRPVQFRFAHRRHPLVAALPAVARDGGEEGGHDERDADQAGDHLGHLVADRDQ